MRWLCLAALICGCATPYRPTVQAFQRPDWHGEVKRVRLKFTAITETAVIGDSSVIATPNNIGFPQAYQRNTQRIADGASLVPALQARFELGLTKAGLVVTDTPPIDVVMEMMIGRIRFSPQVGWLADGATLTIRDPTTNELLSTLDVSEATRAVSPVVLLDWTAGAVAAANRPHSEATSGRKGR